MKINDTWRELRPQIGSFVSALDGLCKGAEDIDEVVAKAEARGYKKGLRDGAKPVCNECEKAKFFNDCNGCYDTIRAFMKLSMSSRSVIARMIQQMLILENSEHKE